jgi:hypothetical protein
LRLLRARADETWEQVAQTNGDRLSFEVGAGVYRAEVRVVPRHLTPWLGSEPEKFLKDYVWIYSNPVYVAPGW